MGAGGHVLRVAWFGCAGGDCMVVCAPTPNPSPIESGGAFFSTKGATEVHESQIVDLGRQM